MAIGNPDWFQRRKYGGWGLHPKNWKGSVYIASFLLILVIFQALPYWDIKTRFIFTGVWALILAIDVIDIMARMKKDEREKIHEAIAERNAMWAISIILSVGLVYQIIISALNQKLMIDWWIAGALFAGLIIKSITNCRLSRKN